MPKKFKFRIQPLLHYKNGNLRAGMSPMGFADEISERLHKPINILVRVSFDDPNILQQHDHGEKTEFDHLVIGYQDEKEFWLTFWMDKGDGLPIGIAFGSDKTVWITPSYKATRFIKKLSDGQVRKVFQHLFEHPEDRAIGINRHI
ncbi:hypothetical protein [Puia dinghuensis]|uniref:Uncharacterized protein n=1 Tax=Puia dinghuensis TaxID=1792502 RepID=A0A8J2UB82_9BACT|nr:hypothetical protein [Puia dinghuensis]GGA92692.1 hypothetical protein GCM10011511_15100 [Puia dinghuensis]